MGRGLVSGLFWGSALSLALIWVMSQMGGVIDVLNQPAEVTIKAPDPVAVAPLDEDVAALATKAAPEPAPEPEPDAPVVQVAPEPETEPSVVDVLPTNPPETSDATAQLADPEPGDDQAVVITTEAPVRPVGAGEAPQAGQADPTPVIVDLAPVPDFTQPVVVEPTAPVVPDASAAPVPEPQPAPDTETAIAEAPVAPDADPLPESDSAPEALPEPEPEPQPEVFAEVAPAPEAEPDVSTAPETDSTEPVDPADPERAGTLEAAAGIGDLAPNVKVNRLPTIGGEVEVAPEPETDPVPETATDGPAIERFAAAFANPENRPVMAILLIDEGGARPTADELAAFPFAVSYVVDASRPDAGEAMADYRAAGREVVALAPLPDRAEPQDVETSFEAYLGRMPEVVAMMDTPAAGFQSDRDVAKQVAAVAAAQGMGLITYSKGLNAVTQVASRSGVPAKLVFREFDADGQDSRAIQRFLDNAAFKAAQGPGVILVGHNRPDTIAALLEWGLGTRAATIALAPVSAALLAE